MAWADYRDLPISAVKSVGLEGSFAFLDTTPKSYGLLAHLGITGSAAPITLGAASALDIGLGLATWVHYRLQLFGLIQIGAILSYTLLITVAMPEYWIHPFGPITKNFPIIIATLIMLALERR